MGLILQGSDESVALAGKSFDIPRLVRRVAERLAEFVDSGVETLLKIDESGALPEVILEFLATYYFAGALNEERQDLEGLALQPNTSPEFTQIPRDCFELEGSEGDSCVGCRLRSHKGEGM